jgi:hypothetical protein
MARLARIGVPSVSASLDSADERIRFVRWLQGHQGSELPAGMLEDIQPALKALRELLCGACKELPKLEEHLPRIVARCITQVPSSGDTGDAAS